MRLQTSPLSAWLRRLSAWPRVGLIGAVRAYRYLLSPVLGSACRFEPTCSAYALTALQSHGAMIGSALTVRRLMRCHPWCAGGHDPVPTQVPRLFAFLSTEASTERSTGSKPSGT